MSLNSFKQPIEQLTEVPSYQVWRQQQQKNYCEERSNIQQDKSRPPNSSDTSGDDETFKFNSQRKLLSRHHTKMDLSKRSTDLGSITDENVDKRRLYKRYLKKKVVKYPILDERLTSFEKAADAETLKQSSHRMPNPASKYAEQLELVADRQAQRIIILHNIRIL